MRKPSKPSFTGKYLSCTLVQGQSPQGYYFMDDEVKEPHYTVFDLTAKDLIAALMALPNDIDWTISCDEDENITASGYKTFSEREAEAIKTEYYQSLAAYHKWVEDQGVEKAKKSLAKKKAQLEKLKEELGER